MRKVSLAMIALAGSALGSFAAAGPALASGYPWCAQGPELGYPGQCYYRTLRQCQASVSGRFLACGVNPYAAYGRSPRYSHRHRHFH